MNWFHKPYISVAERRIKALRTAAALRKKGQSLESVAAATPRGRIALSFWGDAWCRHMESFSDFANRLPRGRSYLRNGSVVNLSIDTGRIDALVMGSQLYRQTVRIDPLPLARWKAVKQRCSGRIGSLIELLRGELSDEIMAVVTDRATGLFPGPKEIHLDCSCPDWADLCKHLAAVLYGVGARLDAAPELLFKLRGVDHAELIQADAAALARAPGKRPRRALSPADLGAVFGIDLEAAPPPAPPRKKPAPAAPFQPTAAAVSRLREQLNLSRAAFADRLGVSSVTIANWEGKSGPLNPQPRSLAALRRLHAKARKLNP